MKRLKNNGNKFIFFFIILISFIYINNSSLLTESRDEDPFLLAHRGMSQTFHMEGITADTCTAKRIYEPEHPFLENTIASMEAAFKAGADIVELDIHPTTDGKFAVFHDWTLECRTNGKGVTREHTMEELKQLDIGYGYTADNGKTYPFRGKGVGLMPSLEEVLTHFPEQSFLIHMKSNDPKEGEQLAEFLAKLPKNRLGQFTVYGGDEPIITLKEGLPEIRVMSKLTMKNCLIPYIAVGWTGYVPASCENTQLHIPESIAPWLWGFPSKFLNRMADSNTRVILVAGGGGFSEGFDKKEDLERVPINYFGGIWTNRIVMIAPILKE
ncbi:glycerophosphodiester phosphodiesterase family protein [Ammoniphilus sp. 3BR4]|uniref:glycerophosphodiester phosphodiesterase family protein n=1 Tax=Ammoniphilus sp. 3BR4 TaxID=3158265 RepID=UPI003465CEEC